jgi:hypothetical protein
MASAGASQRNTWRLLHATLTQYPGALLWSLADHLEAQRSPPEQASSLSTLWDGARFHLFGRHIPGHVVAVQAPLADRVSPAQAASSSGSGGWGGLV